MNVPLSSFTANPDKLSVLTSDSGQQIISVVYTDPAFSRKIVDYFSPTGLCLDPCRGKGAFYDAMPEPKEWCEIQEGRDFHQYEKEVDWIITNPPWSSAPYTAFADRCFKLSKNVVFLVKLLGALGTQKRLLSPARYDLHLKEVVLVPWETAGLYYHDGTPKSAEGFALAVMHWQKGWQGGTQWTYDWLFE